MIVGVVEADGREARIELLVRGPGGDRAVQAVIDTGFNGWLTLRIGLVEELGLVRRASHRGVLADGREVVLGLYEATVLWDGSPRRLPALASRGTPLVGMSLLRGYELTVQVISGGSVRIVPLGRV